MKVQECGWPERDCRPTKPRRPNPKRTESSDQAVPGAQIWDTSARAIQNQQLMFGKNGFCDYGAHATWPNDAHNGSDRMDKQDNQITHAGF
jgi:hypothetical protein